MCSKTSTPPITLTALAAGEPVTYLPPEGLATFDLVLSYTGGPALDALATKLGARRVAPLYGHVDPAAHRPVAPAEAFRSDFSYLGTYAADRQPLVDALFLQPAAAAPDHRFVLGGAGYPARLPVAVQHLVHGSRRSARPSGLLRLLARDTQRHPPRHGRDGLVPLGAAVRSRSVQGPIVSDSWDGLDAFFTPGEEILLAATPQDVLAALARTDAELARIAAAAAAA